MDAQKSSFYKFSLAAVIFCIALISSVLITAQPPSTHHPGVPEDWSYHHLIFSNPGTYEQAIARGTYSQWIKFRYDTRFILQQMKRSAAPRGLSPQAGTAGAGVHAHAAATPLSQDWTMDMGSGATVGVGQSPSKFSYDTTNAYCDSDPAPDFVVYNTGLAGVAGTSATGTVTIHSDPSGRGWAGATVTIGATTYTFVNTTPTSAGEVRRYTSAFLPARNEDRTAQNLNAAINKTATCYGGGSACYDVTAANASVTASVAANVVTVTAITPGTAGNSIVLATNYDTGIRLDGATTTSTTLGSTGTPGVNGQASIIAYDNLYAGCPTGRVPLVYWQYNTGGRVVTSPVLSLDGSQVAFVESDASNVASLVLLKWSRSSTLETLTNTPAGSYRSCTAPCMTSITFHGSPNDTNSSPFPDFESDDAIYVGDNSGVLHQFTGVFWGTPAETTGGGSASGWPVTVSSGSTLTSAIYDFMTGNVFVGSSAGRAGGRLHYVPSTGGASHVVSSSRLAVDGSTGVVDSPIVDSVSATVYVDVNDDETTHAGVFQFTTTFTSGTGGTEETLGQGSTTGALHYGAFDNTYFSGSQSSPTGNLYICGRASSSQIPTLWQVPITANVMGAPVAGPALATGATDCAPLTEFLNGADDWLFLSVGAHNRTTAPISCPAGNGCFMSFNLAGWTPSTATSSTFLEAGGTSGSVIDNSVGSGTLAGASNVYFSTLTNDSCTGNGSIGSGTGGCAVQAPQ
jgi:hypothetical protein